MNLVYVRYVGTHYNDEHIYEVFFSKDMASVIDEGFRIYGWDESIMTSESKAPQSCDVYIMNCKHKLTLAVETYSFSMTHTVNGIVSLAWSDEMVLDGYVNLKFGMKFKDVEEHLYSKNIILKSI